MRHVYIVFEEKEHDDGCGEDIVVNIFLLESDARSLVEKLKQERPKVDYVDSDYRYERFLVQ
jgi:hypothetical protein